MDQHVEVTTQSWGSRLKGAIGGVLFGLVLLVASFPLLFWNEGRAVKTAKSLKEGAAAVVAVDAGEAMPGNEGKLVHLTGEATTEETLSDPKFGISERALRLRRSVEMYQWMEDEDRETREKLGGGTETITTYSYDRGWDSQHHDSSSFKKPAGHENPPSLPYGRHEAAARSVNVGAFDLSTGLRGKLSRFRARPVEQAELDGAGIPGETQLVDGKIYVGADPSSPQVGDLRISFSVVPPSTVSIVARQAGAALGPYTTSVGRDLEMLEWGSVAAEGMFQRAEKRNTMLTWALRGGGFLAMWVGIGLILNPLAVLADVVPFIGRLVGAGTGIAAGLLAASLSLMTVAIGWLAYRPLLGGGLIAASVAVFALVFMRRKKTAPPPLPRTGGGPGPPPLPPS